jgi:hypothetical protein
MSTVKTPSLVSPPENPFQQTSLFVDPACKFLSGECPDNIVLLFQPTFPVLRFASELLQRLFLCERY